MSTDLAKQPDRAATSYIRVAGLAVAGLLIALVAALAVAAVTFGMTLYPLPKDLQDLSLFLLASGTVSIVLGAIGFRIGLGTRIPSLVVTMALVYLVGAAVVGVNVLYASAQMFLNTAHDLPLLMILLLFSAIISLFFAFFLSQSIVMRLRNVLAVSRQVAQGDLTARADVNSRDEIGQLASEFNSMVANWINHAPRPSAWKRRAAS